MPTLDKEKIVLQCRREYEAGIGYRQGRVKDWQVTEDLYYGRVKKSIKGRFNIPLPVMSGFVDTLYSKLDEPPVVKFKPVEEADYRSSKKVQALWDLQTSLGDSDFDSKDLDAKKLAIFYGRAIFKAYAESDPKFKFCIHVVDPYDFYVDPTGGGDLEEARYLGEDNIFKSKSELIQGANDGIYDKKNVHLLVNGMAESVIKENDDAQMNKANRLAAIGLTSMTYNFMGEGTQKLIESGTIYNGQRYYVLWDYKTGLALRCEPIEEIFESGLWWWTSWATNRDKFNFWSKAPADDIRPVAETLKILANQELDNRQKRNFGQRAYDPAVFPNGAELEYRPNGLVAVKSGVSQVQQIASGIYEFETPELNGTINLVNWLDNFAGQKTGVTAGAQGQSEDAKVGIYQGNLQQVADRLGLYNKSYVKCHAAIARRFVWGAYEHLSKPQAVRLLGEKGVEWDKVRRSDVNPDIDIMVESSSAEAAVSEAKAEKRFQAISAINANPLLIKGVNPKWMVEQILTTGGFMDEEIRVAVDVSSDGNREILSVASEKIQEIIAGKTPKLFRGATTGFMQKIVDFATDNTDGDMELYNKLMAYAQAHQKIVMENTMRKAMKERSQAGLGLPGAMPQAPGVPAPSEAPVSPEAPEAPVPPTV